MMVKKLLLISLMVFTTLLDSIAEASSLIFEAQDGGDQSSLVLDREKLIDYLYHPYIVHHQTQQVYFAKSAGCRLAEELFVSNLNIKDLPALLREAIRKRGYAVRMDPYALQLVLEEFLKLLAAGQALDYVAPYRLTIRAVMLAPSLVKQTENINLCVNNNSPAITQFAQAIKKKLPHLYNFYSQEAEWMKSQKDPFSRHLLLESIDAMLVARARDNLSYMTDINLYWHLLRHLPPHNEALQKKFWHFMMKHDAIPYTIIDWEGNTPLDYADRFGLTYIRQMLTVNPMKKF